MFAVVMPLTVLTNLPRTALQLVLLSSSFAPLVNTTTLSCRIVSRTPTSSYFTSGRPKVSIGYISRVKDINMFSQVVDILLICISHIYVFCWVFLDRDVSYRIDRLLNTPLSKKQLP
jgi:hypothetical protein